MKEKLNELKRSIYMANVAEQTARKALYELLQQNGFTSGAKVYDRNRKAHYFLSYHIGNSHDMDAEGNLTYFNGSGIIVDYMLDENGLVMIEAYPMKKDGTASSVGATKVYLQDIELAND